MTTKTPEELVEKNLKYVGEKRLMVMKEDNLKCIAALMRKEGDDEIAGEIPKIELVNYILGKKEERIAQEKKKSPLSQESAAKIIQKAIKTVAEAKPETTTPTTPTTQTTTVVKKRHKLRVVAFNSLKLRLSVIGLEEQWLGLMKEFSKFDVILVSEVPEEAKIKDVTQKRAYLMKLLLDANSHELSGRGDDDAVDDLWQIAISKPSGPGNQEVHVVFAKKPVEILKFTTNFNANGTALDHAPLCVIVKDERFEEPANRTWSFSSVHFPPKARARERDAQIKAFLSAYSTNAEFRCDTPFTTKGAKDAQMDIVHHVVAGDFNCFPDPETFELKKNGFAPPLLGECVSTSAGGSAYDNFIVCTKTEQSFVLNRTIFELEMVNKPADGSYGVSDHSPIMLSIQEAKTTKKTPKSSNK